MEKVRELFIFEHYFREFVNSLPQKIKKMETTNKHLTSFDEYLDESYGKIGTGKRTDFEIKANAFAIVEILKEERCLFHVTQQHWADKTGTKSRQKRDVTKELETV